MSVVPHRSFQIDKTSFKDPKDFPHRLFLLNNRTLRPLREFSNSNLIGNTRYRGLALKRYLELLFNGLDYTLTYKNPTKILKELYRLELERTKTKQNEKGPLFFPTSMGKKEAEKPAQLQTD